MPHFWAPITTRLGSAPPRPAPLAAAAAPAVAGASAPPRSMLGVVEASMEVAAPGGSPTGSCSAAQSTGGAQLLPPGRPGDHALGGRRSARISSEPARTKPVVPRRRASPVAPRCPARARGRRRPAQGRELQRIGHEQHPLRRVRRPGSPSATRPPSPPDPPQGKHDGPRGRTLDRLLDEAPRGPASGRRMARRLGRPSGAAEVLAPPAHRLARLGLHRASSSSQPAASAAPLPGRSASSRARIRPADGSSSSPARSPGRRGGPPRGPRPGLREPGPAPDRPSGGASAEQRRDPERISSW